MAIKIPRKVYEGIEFVRQSGKTNMLDRNEVTRLCIKSKHYEAANWICKNKSDYSRLLFEGPEVINDEQK